MGEGGLPVLGVIRAGPLEEAVATQTDNVLEAGGLLPHAPGDFLLRVRGDSMINEGILPNDLVLLRPGIEVPQGGIAAVLVGSEEGEYAGECEATLKRVYREGESVRLQAGNPAYPDLLLPGRAVQVAGVYKGLIRHVGAA